MQYEADIFVFGKEHLAELSGKVLQFDSVN